MKMSRAGMGRGEAPVDGGLLGDDGSYVKRLRVGEVQRSRVLRNQLSLLGRMHGQVTCYETKSDVSNRWTDDSYQ